MARFTIRVAFRDTQTAQVQADLDQAMEARGFARTIVADGSSYQLPVGEYRIATRATRGQVRSRARSIAAQMRTPCAVLVTEGACSWYNLAGAAARPSRARRER